MKKNACQFELLTTDSAIMDSYNEKQRNVLRIVFYTSICMSIDNRQKTIQEGTSQAILDQRNIQGSQAA